MTLLVSILIFVPKILVGFAVAHFLWRESDLPAVLLKLSVGVPMGLAISAATFFIAMLAGLSPNVYSWLEFGAALGIAVIFLLYEFLSKEKNFEFRKFTWQDLFGALIFLAGAVLSIGAFLYYAKAHPYGFEDAWSIWNFPARMIFRENSADILLNSQFYNRFHSDYPVALSLNVAWGWFIVRNELTRIPIAIALLSTFTPAIVLWATLGKWKSSLAGALAGLIVVLIPDLPSAVGQYADPLLALYMLAASALFYGYLRSRADGLMLLAGLLAGFSAWAKNEGLLFIGVFSIVCFLAAWKKNISWKSLKLLGISMIVPVIVVLLFKSVVESRNDIFMGNTSLFDQIGDLARLALIGKSFLVQIIGYANWPVSIVLVLLAYAILMGFDANESSRQILLLLLILGQLAGYYLIYLITPHNLEMHILTSINRLVFHVFPMLILWLFVAFRSPNLGATMESPNSKHEETGTDGRIT